MVSVSANKVVLPGSVATKKAIVLTTTFLVLSLTVDASRSLSGQALPGWPPAESNSSEVTPAASDTSSIPCLLEFFMCLGNEGCITCANGSSDDDTEGDDDSFFDSISDCDEAWDLMCTEFGQPVNGTSCVDNAVLFAMVHCVVQDEVGDCPATELCSGAMGFAHSSGAAVIVGSVAVASLLMTAVGMVL